MSDDPPTASLDTGPVGQPAREEIPDRIGSYKILGVLGEGGFGVVYEAEQTEPVRRRVALKIIKAGMDSKAVVARFEAERQALAVMNHPGVAKVLDGGVTDAASGSRPYFSMELVRGDPITDYCDREKLTIRERVALFRKVCDAVQHAHTKGVIHRDLKPSNILVTHTEAGPQPKVIDFGVAKALTTKLTDSTVYTAMGQMIGTPEYMSPEQAEMTGVDIDTRADVYSLGVVLYELLTGIRPFDGDELRGAGVAGAQKILREKEAPRPSTRLSTVLSTDAENASRIAERRDSDIRQLQKRLRGELDWVVLKCLRKERERRYESVNGLSMELERFLNGEVVLARPPSRVYRARKFVRRNRVGVAAGTVVLLAIVAGAAVSVNFAIEARVARDLALAAQAETAEKAGELERVAEFQSAQLRDANIELVGARLRDSITDQRRAVLSADGLSGREFDAAIKEMNAALVGVNFFDVGLVSMNELLLERWERSIDVQFPEATAVRASLLQTLADVLRAVGQYERAEGPQAEALRIRRAVLGNEDLRTMDSVLALGELEFNLSDRLVNDRDGIAAAGPLLTEAYEGRVRVLGPDHPDTLSAKVSLAQFLAIDGRSAEAQRLQREVLEARTRLGMPEDAELFELYNDLAVTIGVDVGPLDPEVLDLHEQAVAGYERIGAIESADGVNSSKNLADLYSALGRHAEAESLSEKILERSRRTYGELHRQTTHAYRMLSSCKLNTGQPDAARRLLQEAYARQRATLPARADDVIATRRQLIFMHYASGTPAPFEADTRDYLAYCKRTYGTDHPETLAARNDLLVVLELDDRWDEAAEVRHEVIEIVRAGEPLDQPRLIAELQWLGRNRTAAASHEEAEVVYREALEMGEALNAEHPVTLQTKSMLGASLAALGRFAEAEPLLLDASERFAPPPQWGAQGVQQQREVFERTAQMYEAWDGAEPGAGHEEKAAAWRARMEALGE